VPVYVVATVAAQWSLLLPLSGKFPTEGTVGVGQKHFMANRNGQVLQILQVEDTYHRLMVRL